MSTSTEPHPAACPDKKRGTNYTADKDICIVEAFMHVSTDTIAGNEQPAPTYHGRIYDHYRQNKPLHVPLRSPASVESRVKDIKKLCAKFFACFASVKAMKRSGIIENGEIRLATALFNGKTVEHPREDVGREFKFLPVWTVLLNMPRFSAGDRTKHADDVSSRSTGESARPTKQARPVGRTKAKEEREKRERAVKKLRMAASAIELQKKQMEELHTHNMILLFTNGPGGAESDEAREFFKLKQQQAPQSLRNEVEKAGPSDLDELANVAAVLPGETDEGEDEV